MRDSVCVCACVLTVSIVRILSVCGHRCWQLDLLLALLASFVVYTGVFLIGVSEVFCAVHHFSVDLTCELKNRTEQNQ